MKRTYYHATPYENLFSVTEKGIIKGIDGVVYLTEKPYEAARFVAIRGFDKILVLGVEIDEDKVKESFDHSEAFFKCKAYFYPEDISVDEIISFSKYER